MKRAVISLLLLPLLLISTGTNLASRVEPANPPLDGLVDALVLDVVNPTIAALSDDGRWLAITTSSQRDRIGIDNSRFGDPTYIAPSVADVLVIETTSGRSQKVFQQKVQTRGFKWSPDGGHLAMFVLKGDLWEPTIWERPTAKLSTVKLPTGKRAAENAELEWSPNGNEVMLAVRPTDWWTKARERFVRMTQGPVFVQSSTEDFLAWEDLRRSASLRSVISLDVRTGATRELLSEKKINTYNLLQDGLALTFNEDITKKTDYDVINGVESQVMVQPVGGGDARKVISSTKGITINWSRDGRGYAYAKDGNIFVGGVDGAERQLIGKKEDPDKTKTLTEAEKKEAEKNRFNVVRVSPNGSSIVVSNKEGMWLVDSASGSRELILKVNEDDKEAPRHQVQDFSPDGKRIYFTYASRTKWERGLVVYDIASKSMRDLVKDGRIYSNYRLSENGSTWVFTLADGNRPADVYVANAELENVRRLTDLNPGLKQHALGRTELTSYLDVDGNRQYGVIYYPVNYEPGKKYPTIFEIYEQFFDDTYSGTFNVMTSSGYVVVRPSVQFETGFPGEAWLKGVTAAANKVIEMGIADPDRLAVQGTSYGGYATNLLITQTNRFKAAINISGKVNMISFYTDSPRLGVRNIHAPEKSQDRIGATLWQQPQKYLDQSAIMFADRIKTPLLLMTGDQDSNVPARQAMEMYYALRRLGKQVEWVNYMKGGHGMPTSTVDEVKDYHQRIIGWYDKHLKAGALSSERN